VRRLVRFFPQIQGLLLLVHRCRCKNSRHGQSPNSGFGGLPTGSYMGPSYSSATNPNRERSMHPKTKTNTTEGFLTDGIVPRLSCRVAYGSAACRRDISGKTLLGGFRRLPPPYSFASPQSHTQKQESSPSDGIDPS
jgi:hypothetical protein